MINYINILFIYLFILLPLTLITGPAIPDLTITFGGIFALVWIILNENFKFKKGQIYSDIYLG